MQSTAIMEENFTKRETFTLHTDLYCAFCVMLFNRSGRFYCFKTAFIECPVCVYGWMEGGAFLSPVWLKMSSVVKHLTIIRLFLNPTIQKLICSRKWDHGPGMMQHAKHCPPCISRLRNNAHLLNPDEGNTYPNRTVSCNTIAEVLSVVVTSDSLTS